MHWDASSARLTQHEIIGCTTQTMAWAGTEVTAEYSGDASGLKTISRYDARGLLETDSKLNSAGSSVTSRAYDGKGRLLGVSVDGVPISTNTYVSGLYPPKTSEDHTGPITYNYDGLLRVTNAVSPVLSTTLAGFDAYGNWSRKTEQTLGAYGGTTVITRRSFTPNGTIATNVNETTGISTAYLYALSTNKLLTVTSSNSLGQISIEAYFADGTLDRAWGNARYPTKLEVRSRTDGGMGVENVSYTYPDGAASTDPDLAFAGAVRKSIAVMSPDGHLVRQIIDGPDGTLTNMTARYRADGLPVYINQAADHPRILAYDVAGRLAFDGTDIDDDGTAERFVTNSYTAGSFGSPSVPAVVVLSRLSSDLPHATGGTIPLTTNHVALNLWQVQTSTPGGASSLQKYSPGALDGVVENSQVHFDGTDSRVTSSSGLLSSVETASGQTHIFGADAIKGIRSHTDPRTGTITKDYNLSALSGTVTHAGEGWTSSSTFDPATMSRVTDLPGEGPRTDKFTPAFEHQGSQGAGTPAVLYGRSGEGLVDSIGMSQTASAGSTPIPFSPTAQTKHAVSISSTALATTKTYPDATTVSKRISVDALTSTVEYGDGVSLQTVMSTDGKKVSQVASGSSSDEPTPDYYLDISGLTTQIVWQANGGTNTLTIEYSPDLVPEKETIVSQPDAFSYEITRHWDAAHARPIGISLELDDHTFVVTNTYSTNGRVSAIGWTNSLSGKSDSVTYSYLPDSDLVDKISYANGIVGNLGYDDFNNSRTQTEWTRPGIVPTVLFSETVTSNDWRGRVREMVTSYGTTSFLQTFNYSAQGGFNGGNSTPVAGSAMLAASTMAASYPSFSTAASGGSPTNAYAAAVDHADNVLAMQGPDGSESWTVGPANQVIQHSAGGSMVSWQYDGRGNLTNDGVRAYAWDANNRLRQTAPISPVAGDTKWEITYRPDGRRHSAVRYSHDSSDWEVAEKKYFVWHDWHMIATRSVDYGSEASPSTNYSFNVYGLDQAGLASGDSSQAGGGIGGMLATTYAGEEGVATAIPMPDRNGNTRTLVSVSGSTTAPDFSVLRYYEYTPTGQKYWTGKIEDSFMKHSSQTGSNTGVVYTPPAVPAPAEVALAKQFTHQFATKYAFSIPASGEEYNPSEGPMLIDFGYRHYDPKSMRWLSRDPLGESGGLNLYAYCRNDAINNTDPLGLSFWSNITKGDFDEEETTWGGVGGQVGIGLIPIVGQIADARDTAAGVRGVWRAPTSIMAWATLGGAVVGWVPLVGDSAKGAFKVSKKVAIEATQKALTEGVQQGTKELVQQGTKELLQQGTKQIDESVQALSKLDASEFARQATRNRDAQSVVFGKWDAVKYGGTPYDELARADTLTYFHLNNFDEVTSKFDDTFEINRAFIDQQWAQGKEFLFSHNPWEASRMGGSFEREVLHMIDLGADDFVEISKGLWWLKRAK